MLPAAASRYLNVARTASLVASLAVVLASGGCVNLDHLTTPPTVEALMDASVTDTRLLGLDVVKVFDARRNAAGNGLRMRGDLILTCAHVLPDPGGGLHYAWIGDEFVEYERVAQGDASESADDWLLLRITPADEHAMRSDSTAVDLAFDAPVADGETVFLVGWYQRGTRDGPLVCALGHALGSDASSALRFRLMLEGPPKSLSGAPVVRIRPENGRVELLGVFNSWEAHLKSMRISDSWCTAARPEHLTDLLLPADSR